MRIDFANTDPAALDTGSFKDAVTSRDCAFDQPGFYPCDRVDQANVRRDMDDPEIGRREHHRDLIDTGQRREHFGVAWIEIAPGMQGLFVQGSRADRVDPTGHGEFRGCLDVAECGCARDR